MLCGLFCALWVLTSGSVHTLMAKDTEGEQKMDEYYQVVQTLPQWLARPLGQLPSETQRLYMSCGSGWAVLHSLRYEGEAARLHSWHLN